MVGMGYIGLDSGRLYRMRRGPKLIEAVASGTTIIINDATEGRPFRGLRVFGKSTQDGAPSVENPVPIVSAGDSGEIEAKVYGGNLISSDISSWNSNGWGTHNDTVLQLSDGIKIKVINGWKKVYYDTSEMNGKTLNLSFDYRQIESETTSPITDKAFAVVVQDENVFPQTSNSIFPFRINSPETVKTHVSVSFIARNYLCLFLRVNTEGEEAGETRAIEVTNIMLNAGNTELTYEPYKTPQSIVLSTPNGLPGIPVSSGGNYTDADGQQYICDEINLARGKYVQRVKDFIINRNTNISTSMGDYGAPEKDTILARYLDKTIKKLGAVLCRELICAKNWSNDSESVFATETSIDFRLSRKRLGLETETTTDENKTAVLKFLETTPLHCLVELNTSIERDLTPEEITAYKALRTYGPTTVVSNDAGAEMEITYRKDKKNEKIHWNKVD